MSPTALIAPPRLNVPLSRVRRPPAAPPQVMPIQRIQPQADRLVAHLAREGHPSGVHLEYTACAGSLLGGPLAPATLRRHGCRGLPEAALAEAHLEYLRALYRTDTAARVTLDQIAGQLAYGHNRIAIIADSLGVAQNVIRAAIGLAGRLPVWPED